MRFLAILLVFVNSLQAQKTEIAAHRGKTFLRPENTVRSINKALALGVKYIEIDIRTSKDGKLVIMHDGSLKRTTNSNAKVTDLTWKELQELKICGWLNLGLGNDKIPSLEEVASLMVNWNQKNPQQIVNLYVDCKDAEAEKLIKTLSDYGLLKESVFYGKDEFLKELKRINPDIKVLAGLKNESDLVLKQKDLEPYAFDISSHLISKNLIDKIHQMGILVFSDLLFLDDNAKNYKMAKKAGLDIIQTDRPKRALKVLN